METREALKEALAIIRDLADRVDVLEDLVAGRDERLREEAVDIAAKYGIVLMADEDSKIPR